MVDHECKKFVYREVGKHVGRYCKDCGRWIKWIKQEAPGNFVMPYGKHKGKRIKDMPVEYLEWLSNGGHKNITKKAKEYLETKNETKENV